MNDKEMIEQMARIIDDRLLEASGVIGSMNNGKGYWIAQKLVEHYQPKIPEGAVVLTEEELYDKGYRKVCKPVIRNGEVVGFVNGADYVPKNLFIFGLSQARKETAEKIYYKAEKKAHFKDGGYYDKDRYYLDMEDLKEILQQFGVEIKEYKDENN